MMRTSVIAIALGLLLASPMVRAEVAPSRAAKTTTHHRVRRAPKKAEPEAPALPAPNVAMVLETPSPLGPWTVRVTNGGPALVRLAADARLLTLEVTPPGATRATTCELPGEMRSDNDDDRALVVPASRAFAQSFDPRLFCFSAHDAEALVPGATVVARLGWNPRSASPPFAVSPIENGPPTFAATKRIDAAPSTIGPSPAKPEAPAPPSSPSSQPVAISRPLTITAPLREDATRGSDATIAVSVHNVSHSGVSLFFRPQTIVLDVTGPMGIGSAEPKSVRCAADAAPAAIVELTTRLAAGASASLDVSIAALCPLHTLDHPGLYAVRTSLDTRRTSGREIGLRLFDGVVRADGSTLVRVREESGHVGLEPRPTLDR